MPTTYGASPDADLVLGFTGDNILGTDAKFSTESSLPTLWEESAAQLTRFA